MHLLTPVKSIFVGPNSFLFHGKNVFEASASLALERVPFYSEKSEERRAVNHTQNFRFFAALFLLKKQQLLSNSGS